MAFLSAILPALIGAGGALGSAYLNRNQPTETPMQGKQRELIDQLLSSVKGDGPFSDLFKMDEDAFKKSYVDPSKSLFQNQIAPQIQQQYISQGQQRGTPLDDTLARAGVDLDQMLNQQYAQYQQGAQDRQLNALSSILGQGPGPSQQRGLGDLLQQGLGGYLAGQGFSDTINKGFDRFFPSKLDQQQQQVMRKGFES